jgi:hypothetical protein
VNSVSIETDLNQSIQLQSKCSKHCLDIIYYRISIKSLNHRHSLLLPLCLCLFSEWTWYHSVLVNSRLQNFATGRQHVLRQGSLSTGDLLCTNQFRSAPLYIENIIYLCHKMRRSIVLSLPLQLVFFG